MAKFISLEPQFADLPPELTEPCPGPVPLPNRDFTLEDVAVYWTTDRKNSAECKARHSSLTDIVTAEREAYQKD